MNCHSCNHLNQAHAKFCMNCGNSLFITCSHCGTQYNSAVKFCMECGKSMLKNQAKNKTAALKSKVANAERRQLTVMFCTIVNVTQVSAQLGAEEFRKSILKYRQLTKTVCDRHKAHVAQYMDDGFLIYFGYPKGLEDAPGAALRASLELKEAFNNDHTSTIQWRFGIHTGQVVVDYHLALGDTTNIAARIEKTAEPNTILVSEATQKLIAGWFELSSIGKRQLKGIDEPMELFKVLHIKEHKNKFEMSIAKGLSPLVDREEEFLILKRYWSNARAGKGNIVLLEGEAGIGKSRLVESLKEEVSKELDHLLVEISCSFYHQNSSFYPIIDFIEDTLLNFEQSDTKVSKQSKLSTFIETSSLDYNIAHPLFSDLLSLPYEIQDTIIELTSAQKKKQIRNIILQILINQSKKQPILLIVEDLHWADASTLEWIEIFVTQLPTLPIFALTTTRPGFKATWINKAQALKLKLGRLSINRIEEICHYQSKGKALPPEVMEQIRERTDGIPLFVEELTRMVLDSDMLIEKEDQYELNGPLQILDIPSTLQDSLISRLDRLDSIKELAQIGAVLGKSFSFKLMQLVSGKTIENLKEELEDLLTANILMQKGFIPESTYIFKHALICDTAYQSLLKSRRQLLHQRVAQVLQTSFEDLIQSQPEILAFHLTEANQIQNAIDYWIAAGILSVKKHALIEGVHHFQKGIDLLPKLEESKKADYELKLLKMITPNLQLSRGYANTEVESMIDRWLVVSKKNGETQTLFDALVGQFTYHTFSGNYSKGTLASEELLGLSKQHKDSYFEGVAHFFSGIQHSLAGHLSEASLQFDQGLLHYIDSEHLNRNYYNIGNLKATILTYASTVIHLLGNTKKAMKDVTDAQAIAFEVKQNGSIYSSTAFRARLHLARGEYDRIEKMIGPSLQVATENDDRFIMGLLSMYRCLGLAHQGDQASLEKAYFIANKLFEVYKSYRIAFLVYIIEAWFKLGKLERGMTVMNEAFKHVYETGEQLYLPELYRLKARYLHLSKTNYEEIEQAYHKSIQVAKSQKDRWHQLHALKNLVTLHQEHGDQDKGLLELKTHYQSFRDKEDIFLFKEVEQILNPQAKINYGM